MLELLIFEVKLPGYFGIRKVDCLIELISIFYGDLVLLWPLVRLYGFIKLVVLVKILVEGECIREKYGM